MIYPWLLAARPKTLTAAFIPILLGTALASRLPQGIQWDISFFALMAALFIQIGTNLINDGLDFKKGADTSERFGPVRAAQAGLLSMESLLAGGGICFAAASLFGIPLIIAGGWPIALLMVLSVLFGYLYTGGPYPLAYAGLGDLFVWIFFGEAATAAAFYLQGGRMDMAAFLTGAQIGCLAAVMIAINNLRDITGDSKVNKRTLAVRFGKTFARLEITLLIVLPFLFSIFWYIQGAFLAAFLPLTALPVGVIVIKGVWKHEPGSVYNLFLGLSAMMHALFGILLAAGIVFE